MYGSSACRAGMRDCACSSGTVASSLPHCSGMTGHVVASMALTPSGLRGLLPATRSGLLVWSQAVSNLNTGQGIAILTSTQPWVHTRPRGVFKHLHQHTAAYPSATHSASAMSRSVAEGRNPFRSQQPCGRLPPRTDQLYRLAHEQRGDKPRVVLALGAICFDREWRRRDRGHEGRTYQSERNKRRSPQELSRPHGPTCSRARSLVKLKRPASHHLHGAGSLLIQLEYSHLRRSVEHRGDHTQALRL
jgi:hypothetical protein